MKRIAIAAALVLCLAACRDDERARALLEAEGYSQIDMVKSGWFSRCSDSDDYETPFVALNRNGRRVSGVVCGGGWGKGQVIRITGF